MTIARILVIAGSDSSGGAGIQADIRTITMLGAHPMTAITAITAQNTQGVQGVHMLPADFVVKQAQSCISDIGVDAVKIGMLGSPDIAHAVADLLEPLRVPIVFDPVMVATSGAILADAETIAGFERLMALAALTTPNLPELEALGGEAVLREKTRALLIKGGHATGPQIENRLVEGGDETIFVSPRIDTRHTHGTGCTLASGIAAGLGAGLALREATGRAIRFVEQAIAHVPGLGHGGGPLGHAMGRVPFDDMRPIADQGWAGGN
ncbi:bifunctional hydroxymethylpyrimidine kinase/phosphomethylpyrimidine kinase [Croceicoccus hydrothermalis]|uniref:bifunctional hydroxymethylpyrimidine kinase/phosphomethylpyrimidine kinase n=1 Tax=Croceicoccus hydrothermalis TaxID=2867964 RepID=UPI001EFB0D3D|nr:bifunctional hydroxymethylpyrimidine kinase/phosphomethylpyrimidine kinase [Croceicoccus hydrothermalis]